MEQIAAHRGRRGVGFSRRRHLSEPEAARGSNELGRERAVALVQQLARGVGEAFGRHGPTAPGIFGALEARKNNMRSKPSPKRKSAHDGDSERERGVRSERAASREDDDEEQGQDAETEASGREPPELADEQERPCA